MKKFESLNLAKFQSNEVELSSLKGGLAGNPTHTVSVTTTDGGKDSTTNTMDCDDDGTCPKALRVSNVLQQKTVLEQNASYSLLRI